MQPAELTPASFAAYPPEARSLAAKQLSLLRELPLPLAPILLRELIAYDWKLPAERRELDTQFKYLSALSPSDRAAAVASFRALPLTPALAATDWVNNPSGFLEQLTAWLWSTHQMDRFRGIADTYTAAVKQAIPDTPPALARLGIVVIGSGVEQTSQPLFRKLRPSGVHFTSLLAEDGFATMLAAASRRAATSNSSGSAPKVQSDFDHWYIDGGSPSPAAHLTQVSYDTLEQPRAALLNRIQQAIATGGMGPEELRSLLARMKPEEIGLTGDGAGGVLNHFQLSLLTEGSGTQIFATTFVQWAARECVRRAQPETLIVRYAPRRQAETMNAMLSGARPAGLDPAGSLIDADVGAYYTWLNMRRLSGSDRLRFLVWFEGHREAIAIGPGLPAGTSSDSKLHMDQVLALLG